MNEEIFFNDIEATAWNEELYELAEIIQERPTLKNNLQFLEWEMAKSEKKLAEDTLGKLSIELLKDAIDF